MRWSIAVLALFFLGGAIGCSDDASGVPRADAGGDGAADARSCLASASRTCVEGVAFVDCAGVVAPEVFCGGGEAGRCVWVSDGCPIGDYTHRVGSSCSCGDTGCPPSGTISSFFYGFGTAPWSRQDPAMNIAVSIDENVNGANDDSIQCGGAGAADCSKPTICCAMTTGPGGGPVTLQTTKQLWDTFALRVGAKGTLAGWQLLLEVDLDASPPAARACRVPFTDNPNCGDSSSERECAIGGSIGLSASPAMSTFEGVRGTFSVTFPSGLEISGAFK